jgi:hypothetical protein
MTKYLVTLATIKSMANKVTIEYLVPLEMTPSLVVQITIGANNVTFVDMDFNHGRFPLNVVQVSI